MAGKKPDKIVTAIAAALEAAWGDTRCAHDDLDDEDSEAAVVTADDRRPYLAMILVRHADLLSHGPRKHHLRRGGKNQLRQPAAEHHTHVTDHAARGAPHPSRASMTDFLPVIDRPNAETCR
jgi:hypothetical protein